MATENYVDVTQNEPPRLQSKGLIKSFDGLIRGLAAIQDRFHE
jgi:hypothetical protein